MSPEVLAQAGELIFGPEWQRPLARMLGSHHPSGERPSLDPRLVQRWASGERPVPSWVPGVLAAILGQRAGTYKLKARECEGLAAALRAIDEGA